MKRININAILAIIVMCFMGIIFLSANVEAVQLGELKLATTVEKVENLEDSNNYLKNLQIEGYELFPEFNRNTTQYYLSIPSNISSVKVNAETEVEASSFKSSGESKLTKAENTITITVTSKNKKTKKYSIIVTKQDDDAIKLKKLSIEGANLEPEFNENKNFYKVSIEQIKTDKINPLVINAEPKEESTKIEILGNDNLTEGDNLITILLTDDEKITTYQIIANISSKVAITSFEGTDNFFTDIFNNTKNAIDNLLDTKEKKISFIVALVTVIVVIIILIIVSKHKKGKARKNKENIKKRAR